MPLPHGGLKDVMRKGFEGGSFEVAQNDPLVFAATVLAAWSLVHDLTLLYIDGLATLETSLSIDQLAGMVSEMFIHGLAR